SPPDLPRRLARGPQVVKQQGVLVCVHAIPEAFVAERAQLTAGCQPRQRLALEHRALIEQLEDRRLEAEEPTVDPPLAPRFLDEGLDEAIPVQLCHAELELRSHHGYRRAGAMPIVFGN